MKFRKLRSFVTVLALSVSNLQAYQVWIGTHLMRSSDATNLQEWSQMASQVDGININRAPHDTEPASNNEYRTIIRQFTNAQNTIAEFARSQATRDPSKIDELAFPSIADRLTDIFSLANSFDYDLTGIMFYDERGTFQGTEYLYEWTDIEIQYLRDWLDTNGHPDVELKWNVRNNSLRNQQISAKPVVDSVEIEASTTALLANTNNQITFFEWFWNNSDTRHKPIALQIPRVLPGDTLNQFQGTRRVAKLIGERIGHGEDGMRSDRLIFLPVTYNDNYDFRPETVNNGAAYTNTLSSIALSLIEQRSLFEGRTRVPTNGDADSTARHFAPTVSGISNQILASGTTTGAIAFTVGDDATSASALTVSRVSSDTTLVPISNIALGGSGANRTVSITPAAGQSGSSDIELWVSDGTLATAVTFTVTVLSSGIVPGTLFSEASDCSITEAPAIEKLTSPTVDLGARGSSPWVERCTVYVFQLPNLGVVTNPFTEASFSFNFIEKTGTLRGYDLYGLGRRSSPTVQVRDFYSQTSSADPTDATRLQQTIINNNTPVGLVRTTSGGSANLLNYLNTQYADGAGAGQYVFLRINTRDAKSGLSSALVTMSEGGAAGTPDTRPQINYQAMGNSPPIVGAIDDQTIEASSNTGALAFAVSDDSTPAGSITLSKASSNIGLVPTSNIVFGGSGANRTVTVTPALGQSGNALISVTASDGSLTTTSSFTLTVLPPGTVTSTIYSDLEDSAPRQIDGQGPSILISTATDASLYAGRGGAGSTVDRCVVFSFQLPSLGSINNPFSDASLSFNLESNNFSPENCNLDLYGLPNRPTAKVLASDYYSETNVADSASGVARLQDNLCVPDTPVGLITSNSTGNTALVAYLNAQYAGGANAGKFVFLRLSKDAFTDTTARRYTVTAADGALVANGGSPDTAVWPQINFTATAGNDAPSISNIMDRSIAVNTGSGAIPFTIGDSQTAPGSLLLGKSSSNLSLVPSANIVFGGSGANRTVTVTPAANKIGSATITISVSDGELSANDTFVVTVTGNAQETWRFTHFGSTSNSGEGADESDANHDGEDNLLEFATGQDPHVRTLVSTPLTMNSGNLEFRYTRSKAAISEGMVFTVEWSETLLPDSWSSAGVNDSPDPANPENDEVENRVATVPAASNGSRFIHLKVSAP
jgi:hypothetical protein